jgi:hypothetical protein
MFNPLVTMSRFRTTYVTTFSTRDGDDSIEKHVYVYGQLYIIVVERSSEMNSAYTIDLHVVNGSSLARYHGFIYRDSALSQSLWQGTWNEFIALMESVQSNLRLATARGALDKEFPVQVLADSGAMNLCWREADPAIPSEKYGITYSQIFVSCKGRDVSRLESDRGQTFCATDSWQTHQSKNPHDLMNIWPNG